MKTKNQTGGESSGSPTKAKKKTHIGFSLTATNGIFWGIPVIIFGYVSQTYWGWKSESLVQSLLIVNLIVCLRLKLTTWED